MCKRLCKLSIPVLIIPAEEPLLLEPPDKALPQKCCTSSASSMGSSTTLGFRPLLTPAAPCPAPLHAIWVVFLLTFMVLRSAFFVPIWLQSPAAGLRI